MVKVYFTNSAGEDVYIDVYDLKNARKLAEELRSLKIHAEIFASVPAVIAYTSNPTKGE